MEEILQDHKKSEWKVNSDKVARVYPVLILFAFVFLFCHWLNLFLWTFYRESYTDGPGFLGWKFLSVGFNLQVIQFCPLYIITISVWSYSRVWVGILSMSLSCLVLLNLEKLLIQTGSVWLTNANIASILFGVLIAYTIAVLTKPVCPALLRSNSEGEIRFTVADILTLTLAVSLAIFAWKMLPAAKQNYLYSMVFVVRSLAVCAAIGVTFSKSFYPAIVISGVAWTVYVFLELLYVGLFSFLPMLIAVVLLGFVTSVHLRKFSIVKIKTTEFVPSSLG